MRREERGEEASGGPATQRLLAVLLGMREPYYAVEQFLKSDRWKKVSKLELMLYDAVNRSIDVTIHEVIGVAVFNARLDEFRRAKARVRSECQSKVVTVCDANGTITNKEDRSACYSEDVGCGYKCVDELFPFG